MTVQDIEKMAFNLFSEISGLSYLNVYCFKYMLYIDGNVTIPENVGKRIKNEVVPVMWGVAFNEKPKDLPLEMGMIYCRNGKVNSAFQKCM